MGQFKADGYGDLRRRAESRLGRILRKTVPSLAPENIEALVHELHVHQCEIEMQCEELRNTQEELAESRNRYRDLYESIPVGYVTLEPTGRVIDINPAALALLGEAPGKRKVKGFSSYMSERDVERFSVFCQGVVASQKPDTDEFTLQPHDRSRLLAHFYAVPVRTGLGAGKQVRMAFRDVTHQKKAEEALRDHEIQLEALMAKLFTVQDEERKRLATELHDQLQQLLVLGKLKLRQGTRFAEEGSPCAIAINDADMILSEALRYTRTLVADLRPPVLGDHGLVAALRWLAEDMKKHDMDVAVLAPREDLTLPENQSVLLFQCIRELVINVRKHAETAEALISLHYHDDELHIVVSDQGKGFDLAKREPSAESSSQFGLFSISERMRSLGGWFDIASIPGGGTKCTLVLRGCHQSKERIGDCLPDVSVNGKRTHDRTDEGISVLLVDDHAMMRQGLRSVLEAYTHLHIVGEAANGEEAILLAEERRPRIIVMDINMPKMNGIEATQYITRQYPDMVVIGLSVNVGDDSTEAMKKAGAALLLTKEAAVDELYQAIQTTLRLSSSKGSYAPEQN